MVKDATALELKRATERKKEWSNAGDGRRNGDRTGAEAGGRRWGAKVGTKGCPPVDWISALRATRPLPSEARWGLSVSG